MKHKFYKEIVTFFAICFLGTAFAQKFDKKFIENFNVNKDIEIVINASNTGINVITWDKNEVQIDAFIEIEGVSKKEAEEYFKDWEFEALGNRKKVKITSKGSNSFGMSKNDIIFFDDIKIEMPDIDFSSIEAIIVPEMSFDFKFDFDFKDLDELEKNMKKNKNYSFKYHNGDEHIVIKSKKEWKDFKTTQKYKNLELKMLQEKVKMRMEILKSRAKMKKTLAKAKLEFKNIDKEKIIKELEKAKETLKFFNFNSSSDKDDLLINGKKIKIKKRLEIKVPKGATFNLNTRHCKVKLPNTVASGNVKYGSFNANNLNGGKLTINYSPVNINDLNACNLFLNNVTDAKIASVTNTILSNNSSDINIIKVNENVTISDKFGELHVNSFNPNFGEFILNLSNSDVTLFLGGVPSKFKYQVNRVKLENKRAGKSGNSSSKNLIKLTGDYSQIVIK